MYPGAQINVDTGVLLIQTLAAKHGFTQAALGDLLRVIKLHMPQDSSPVSYDSVYRLSSSSNSACGVLEERVIHHTLCNECGKANGSHQPICKEMGEASTQFFELPIDRQIQQIF